MTTGVFIQFFIENQVLTFQKMNWIKNSTCFFFHRDTLISNSVKNSGSFLYESGNLILNCKNVPQSQLVHGKHKGVICKIHLPKGEV